MKPNSRYRTQTAARPKGWATPGRGNSWRNMLTYALQYGGPRGELLASEECGAENESEVVVDLKNSTENG